MLAAFSLQAQTERTIVLVTVGDSLFQFKEIVRVDGFDASTVCFPIQPMKKDAFIEYAFNTTKSYNERLSENKKLRKEIQSALNFVAATIDTIAGPGKYQSLENSKIKDEMQGAWTIIHRQEGKENEAFTVMVNGDVMNSKNKSSDITWLDGDSFKVSKTIFGTTSALTFKRVEDRFVTDVVGGTKWVIKR